MITTEHTLVYQHKEHNNYQFTKDGRCFNKKTGKELNQIINSRCIGYCIKGKFISLTRLITQIEKIENDSILNQLKKYIDNNNIKDELSCNSNLYLSKHPLKNNLHLHLCRIF